MGQEGFCSVWGRSSVINLQMVKAENVVTFFVLFDLTIFSPLMKTQVEEKCLFQLHKQSSAV